MLSDTQYKVYGTTMQNNIILLRFLVLTDMWTLSRQRKEWLEKGQPFRRTLININQFLCTNTTWMWKNYWSYVSKWWKMIPDSWIQPIYQGFWKLWKKFSIFTWKWEPLEVFKLSGKMHFRRIFWKLNKLLILESSIK